MPPRHTQSHTHTQILGKWDRQFTSLFWYTVRLLHVLRNMASAHVCVMHRRRLQLVVRTTRQRPTANAAHRTLKTVKSALGHYRISYITRVPVGASGCQRVPAGASGCQRVPAGASGCQRVPAGASGCQRVPAGASGCQWTGTFTYLGIDSR